MKIEALYALYLKHPVVSTDTRKITPNSLFFALKGDNFNGNAFAKRSLEQGASFAIIDEEEFNEGEGYILVKDVLETLQALAQYHRNQLQIPVVAVTGSNGKTTSKELIKTVLSKKYEVAYTKGNLNNHIGVPLTLLEIKPTDQIALVEMGDNHPNEVSFLCQIAQPNFGFVTNVGKDHLEGFGSFEKNILAKKEVFDFLDQTNGVVFLDESDELVAKMVSETQKCIRYGVKGSDSFIEYVSSDPLVVCRNEDNTLVKTQLFGAFNFNNIKLAFCIGKFFDVDQRLISEAISEYAPDNNRSQVVETNKNTLIMDAYNANPSSVEEALNSFATMETKLKKWVVLGDMFELGRYSSLEHQNMAELAIAKDIDEVLLIGENYAKIEGVEGAHIFSAKEDAKMYIKKIAPEGAIVLFKGSRSMRLETLKELF